MNRRIVLLSAPAMALLAAGCAPASASVSAAAESIPDETLYLCFQVFTDSPSPHQGAGSQTLPNGPPTRAALDAFAADILARIGPAGQERRRLGLMFGPILFDHSDEQAVHLIADAFEIALTRDVAVGFHIDDQMFWRGRRDLLDDARNIERPDWSAPPSKARRLDWGPIPERLAPQMCLNSPAIEAEVVRRGRDVIGAAIATGMRRLEEAGKDHLFAGVIAGWETQIGRDFAHPARPLGFCAMTNLGLRPGATVHAMDQARVDVLQRFISLWSQAIADAGVPQARIYSHVAFTPRRYFEERGDGVTYAQASNFALSETAFGASRRAGFSTYPSPGLLEEIVEQAQARGGAPWASAEGANVLLTSAVMERGDPRSGMSMETYLGRHFNRGAALVNIFGWGLGAADNPFRRAAEGAAAIAAYRKFLRGEALIEGPPTIVERLPEKMRRIQAEMPVWIAGRPERQARAQRHFVALTAALEANDLAGAEREADALLALLPER
jgi:hypothetical protein